MEMKNVKAITIPEGAVKKIENSNGDIIWGSQDAFPYRRLEYIHTNGTDNYIATGCTTNTTKYREVTFSMDSAETPSGDIYILGSRNTSAAAAQQRYWLPRIDGNGIRFVIGSTWTSNNAYPVPTYIVANTKRTAFATTSTSSSNMKMDFGLKNESGTNLFTGSITGGAVSGFSSRELILMATNDGAGNSGIAAKGYCAGRVYEFIEKENNSSDYINHYLIPVQRRTDGVVGMYDIITSTFKIMEGTQTATSAGPVIEEYWLPFRQLECLNMYSTYMNLGFRPSASFYYAQCKFPSTWDSYGTWGMVYGAEGWTSSTANRLWFAMQSTSNGRLFQRVKTLETPIIELSSLTQGTLYEARVRNYFAPNNTSGRYWVALQDTTDDSQVYGQYYNAASLSMNLNDFNNIGINIATRRNASGNFYANSGYLSFSLYRFYIKADGGDAASVVFNGIPVQDRTNGICGLYDVYGSKFYPCMGSASSTCGGSVISEYFEPSQLL